MSFWNFLGELAFFNMIFRRLSGKHKQLPYENPSSADYVDSPEYEARVAELQRKIDYSKEEIAKCRQIIDDGKAPASDYIDADTNAIQERIYELEDQLDCCDETSDRYDRIQDEIDRLQTRLDDIEDRQDLYDFYDEFDELEDYFNELDELDEF